MPEREGKITRVITGLPFAITLTTGLVVVGCMVFAWTHGTSDQWYGAVVAAICQGLGGLSVGVAVRRRVRARR